MREENKVFHHLTLTITEVRQQFLNVPIRCFASSPVEKKSGVLWLQEGASCSVVWSVGVKDQTDSVNKHLIGSPAVLLCSPCCFFLNSPKSIFGFCFFFPAGNNSVFKATVAICLTPSLLALVLVTVFLLFRVDLLLAHRRLWKRLAKNRGSTFNSLK